MKETNFYTWKPLLYMMFLVLICSTPNLSAQKICIDKSTDQIIGEQDGYRYELWNQNSQGNACMTLDEGALFSGEWRGIENYLARRGLNYNQTKKHQEIGEFFTNYKCDYKPSSESGNSYLSVYGWTVEPLIEYYIIEDWRNCAPYMSPDATFKGGKRSRGTINISDHFNMWEKFGMKMGKLHEVSFVVEGFKSSGSFEFKELDVFVSRNNSILK
jgi:endo-1,4-beta-xylanase